MRAAVLLVAPLIAGCVTVPPREGSRSPWRSIAPASAAPCAPGIADPATRRAATPDDPVRIASISKLVVAIGVMRLVEQGRLDLDSDVSTNGSAGACATRPFPTGRSPFAYCCRTPVRCATMTINMSSRWADRCTGARRPASWDPATPRARLFQYANLNFPIVASMIERVTGERFDR